MAFILVDGKKVFSGNYWDFHIGCHGPKIAGFDLTGEWSQGIEALALAIGRRFLAKNFKVDIEHRDLEAKEYNSLMGYKAA